MGAALTPYLVAWQARGDWTTRDALWAAACWEQRGDVAALTQADLLIQAAERCQRDILANLECDHQGESCYRRAQRMVRV